MPIEQVKEATKVLVETSGSNLWNWLVGIIGTALMALWGHVTGRIRNLEVTMITSDQLKIHIDDENRRFSSLFEKHDKLEEKHDAILEKVSNIAASVARIEGKLDK